MMRTMNDFYKKPICAVDGELGKLYDFYFDDRTWEIRYLVVELGVWFNAKRVLISPIALAEYDGVNLKVQLTKSEISKCPDSITNPPVSKQQTMASEEMFAMSKTFGNVSENAGTVIFMPQSGTDNPLERSTWNPHLRSSRVVSRYMVISSTNVMSARLDNFLFDDRFWFIRSLIIAPDDQALGSPRLLDTYWVDTINKVDGAIRLSCSESYVLQKQQFEPLLHVNISYDEFVNNYLPVK